MAIKTFHYIIDKQMGLLFIVYVTVINYNTATNIVYEDFQVCSARFYS